MAERETNNGPYPELRIRRSALAHNLTQFRKLAPRSRILLPVKANAYGCGLETLFPFFSAENIDMLGVANPSEAVQLRKLGWQKPILNLGGFFSESVRNLVNYAITPSITDLWQVAALQQAAEQPFAVHLKLDLGMGRIGILERELPELVRALKAAPQLKLAGIFTHFPHSGPDARISTLEQNARFQSAAKQILTALGIAREDVLLHAANSYSTAFFPETHHDVIRPGILFYGYYQSEAGRVAFNSRFELQPCLELLATPISVRTLAHGSGISYSALYHVAAESEHVAVLPLGYADGVPRALSNRISFGTHPLRGRVTMDQIMVGNATGKEPVRLLGDGVPSLETWGDMSESFSYEVMAHLGNRLRRVLVD